MTSRATDLFLEGDHASRPAESTVPVGALYSCTDHDLVYKNNAGTWGTWATLNAPQWVQVTQAEYDALTPDPDTLYVVVG